MSSRFIYFSFLASLAVWLSSAIVFGVMSLFSRVSDSRSGCGLPTLRPQGSYALLQSTALLRQEDQQALRRLDGLSHQQLSCLRNLAYAWENRYVERVQDALRNSADYFNPQKPEALIHFVSSGGIDLFSSLLQDNATWLVFHQHPSSLGGSRHRLSESGVDVIITMLRVLTELLVCFNDLGWYVYDRHPKLMCRLIDMCQVSMLRESAIMLLEHIVSVVGPVIDLAKCPQLVQIVKTSTDSGLAALCRLLALLIVPGVMNEQVTATKRRLEPFPQCVTRMRAIEEVVESNVKILLDIDGFLEWLLRLAGTRANGVRIFQGNRTMTVMMPEPPVQPSGLTGAASAGANDGNVAAGTLLTQLQQLFLGGGVSAVTAAAVGGSGAMPQEPVGFTGQQQQPPPHHHHHGSDHSGSSNSGSSGDHDEYFDDEDVDMLLQAVQQQQQQPQQPQAASSQPVQQQQAQPGQQQALGNNFLSQLLASFQQVQATADAAGGVSSIVGIASDGSVNSQQQLQQVAETLSQGMPAANTLDSINFSWLVGHPEAKVRWRLGHILLHEIIADGSQGPGRQHEWSQGSTTSTKNSAKAKSDHEFFSRLREACDERRRTSRHANSLTQQENQSIVNSQSEVFFVLNSALAASHYTRAWTALTDLDLMSRMNPTFDYVFFRDGSQTSINASANTATHGNATSTSFSGSPSGTSGGASSPCTLYEDPTMDPILLTEADIAERSKVEDDDRHHRHDPDTLRKLELLRIIHEYWNAQDRMEAERLHNRGNTAAAGTLAVKIAQQLALGKEDPCTETVGCHALESFLRCYGPTMPEIVASIEELLFVHTLVDRIYNAPRKCGVKNSVFPQKRMDAFFSVFGELAKYNEKVMAKLGQYLLLTVDDLRSKHPTMMGPLPLLPMARAEFDSMGDAIRRRICQFGGDCNLFIRTIALTCTRGISCPVNYVWKPLRLSTEESAELLVDSRRVLSMTKRQVESTATMISRMFFVRRHSRRFVEELCIMRSRERGEEGHSQHHRLCGVELNAPPVGTLADMLKILCDAPHTHVMSERPFPNLFSDDDLSLLQQDAHLPTAGLPKHLRDAILARYDEGSSSSNHQTELYVVNASMATYVVNQELACDVVSQQLLAHPARLVYAMISSINPEEMENTERLCVVTSSLVLFMRENVLRGESGVYSILDGLREIAVEKANISAAAEKATKTKVGQAVSTQPSSARRCSSPPSLQNPSSFVSAEHQVLLTDPYTGELVPLSKLLIHIDATEGAGCPSETQPGTEIIEEDNSLCEAMVDYGCCLPPSMVDTFIAKHGKCIFKNFFRDLCIWLAHYSCSQRYVETLFYCTHVPYAEWKQTALFVWKTLPSYFS